MLCRESLNLVVVLPWPPRLKALAETELKRCDVADNGQKWEQVCRRTAVNVVGEQAVRLHNIHHLLHPERGTRRHEEQSAAAAHRGEWYARSTERC